jgi:hypothetical protein
MDANKLKKLREVGMQIRPCCLLCKYGRSVGSKSDGWGTCTLHQYEHLKHGDNPRQLSINAVFVCGSFALEPAVLASFGEAWREFWWLCAVCGKPEDDDIHMDGTNGPDNAHEFKEPIRG